MTTLRELVYMIEANTKGLNNAFPSIDKLTNRLGSLEKSITSLDKSVQKSMQGVGRSAQGMATGFAQSTNKIQSSIKRSEAALLGFQTKVDRLRDKIKNQGGESRLLANTQRAYNTLEKTLKNTTASTEEVALAKAKFQRSIANVERELAKQVQTQKNAEKASRDAQKVAQSQAAAEQKSASQLVETMKRRDAAITSAQTKMENLNKAIAASGGDAKLVDANTKAFESLNRVLRDNKATSADVSKATAQYNAALNASKTQLSEFNRVQQQSRTASKATESQMIRQENAIERTRIKYLDLQNALTLQGAKQARIDQLNAEFAQFEATMRRTDLTAKQFAQTQNRMNAEMAKVKRNEGFTDLSKRMQDLATSAQVALGPLSGVASRITAITTLANRNTIMLAGVIGGMIALGSSMVKVIRTGSKYEQQMHKINTVLAVTGNRVNMTAEEIDVIAKKVGDLTLTNQGAARDAAAALLTLRNMTGELLENSLLAAQGMSLIGRGDIASNTRRLTRILEDPAANLKSLSEAGVQFNAVEENRIKLLQRSGNLQEAQNKVMERLTPLIEAAKGETGGLAGAWDSFLEVLTSFFQEISGGEGVIESVTDMVKYMTEQLKYLKDQTQLVNDIQSTYRGTLKILGVLMRGLGTAITFTAKHLDSILVFFTAMIAMRTVTMVLGLAKAFWEISKAMKAMALYTALTTGGITLLVGGLSVLAYELIERFLGAGNAADEARMAMAKLEEQIMDVGGAGKESMKAFQSALSNARQKINEEINKGFDVTDKLDILGEAIDLSNEGKIDEATKMLNDYFGVVKHGTKIMTEHEKQVERAANAYIEFRDNHLGFMKEMEDSQADLENFNSNYKAMIEVITSSGKSYSQAVAELNLMRDAIMLNGNSIANTVNELEKSIIKQQQEIDITNALGAEKKRLQTEQAVLNKLWETGIIKSANYKRALEDLRAMGPEYAKMAEEIANAVTQVENLGLIAQQAEMRKSINEEISKMAVQIEYAVKSENELALAIELAAMKQKMLNAGIEQGSQFWNEQLELVRQLAALNVAQDHIKAMKAMEQQAKEQQAILDTMFYSEKTSKRIYDLEMKKLELAQKYGSILDQNAQRELKAFEVLQERQALIDQWQEVADVVDNTFQSIEDSIVDAAATGKFEIKDMVRSILADILRLNVRTLLRPFQDAVGNFMQNRLGFGGFSLNPLSGTKGPVPVVIAGFQGSAAAIFNPASLTGSTQFPTIGGIADNFKKLFTPGGAVGTAAGGIGAALAAPLGAVTRAPLGAVSSASSSRIYETLAAPIGGMPVENISEAVADRIYDAMPIKNIGEIATNRIGEALSDLPMGEASKEFSNRVAAGFAPIVNAGNATSNAFVDLTNVSQDVSKSFTDIGKGIGDGLSFVGNYKSGVNDKLTAILDDAAKKFESSTGMIVNAVSGFRPGDTRFHGKGLATDVSILDQFGNPLGNYQDASTFSTYEAFAQQAKRSQMQMFPELNDQFRWGGYFSGPAGKYGALDTMHFDLGGGSVGMGGGSFAGGLTSSQSALWPGAESMGMGSDLAGGWQLGMGGDGGALAGLSSSATQATESLNSMATKVPDLTDKITTSFDKVSNAGEVLGTEKLPQMAGSVDMLSNKTLTDAVQKQAVATAQTQTMGAQSTATGAQIQSLGTQASVAGAQLSAAGNSASSGGLLGGIGRLFGFASGGFTGGSSAGDVTGFVHGKEYVFDSEATRNIGVATLDNIRREAKSGNRARGRRVFKGDGAQNMNDQAASPFAEGERGQGGRDGDKYKIINVFDPSVVGDYMATQEGEKLIMNIMRRNGIV